jgi:hypothetical protein
MIVVFIGVARPSVQGTQKIYKSEIIKNNSSL